MIKKSAIQRSITSPGASRTDDIAVFSDASGNVIKTSNIRMVNGKIIDKVTLDNCFVSALSDTSQTVSILSGTLTIDMNLGNVAVFTHDADCKLAFSNIPSDGVSYIYLIRNKDNTDTARNIDWAGSTPTFKSSGGVTPELTQEPQAIDALLLETADGGSTFNVALKIANAKAFPGQNVKHV